MRRAAVLAVAQLQNNFRSNKKINLSYVTSVSARNRKRSINVESCGISYLLFVQSRACSVDNVRNYSQESKVKQGGGPLVEYKRRIAAGKLKDGDDRQHGALSELQRLYDELVASADVCKLDYNETSRKFQRSSWFWSRLMTSSSVSRVRGLYLCGGVGTGKTMLMDLFYDQLPSNWRKKRIHFHDFMINVQSRLQKHNGVTDPLKFVADEISDEAILLCLDEFMVTDVAVALILNTLFTHLFNNGVVLVTTSNRTPDKLYERGRGLQLQRDLFQLFIASLKERCVVHSISSEIDYRKLTEGEQGYYFTGKSAADLLKKKFQSLIADHEPEPQLVEVAMGRKMRISMGANGCAYFSFKELCDRPRGAADYLGLFKKFHTLALEGVPIFDLYNKASACRFVTLVDVMYENKATLLCSAEGTPFDIFEKIVTISEARDMASATTLKSRKNDTMSDLCVDNALAFVKDRTISRLTEMNSKIYLEQHAELSCLRKKQPH